MNTKTARIGLMHLLLWLCIGLVLPVCLFLLAPTSVHAGEESLCAQVVMQILTDKDGNPVSASSDPNNTSAAFFITWDQLNTRPPVHDVLTNCHSMNVRPEGQVNDGRFFGGGGNHERDRGPTPIDASGLDPCMRGQGD